MTSLKYLDLKSVPCPLNVVKIKLALEKLSKNEQLIVELDKGEPEEMVLNNLKNKNFKLVIKGELSLELLHNFVSLDINRDGNSLKLIKYEVIEKNLSKNKLKRL